MTIKRPLNVLVVDDEDSFRLGLEIALKMSDRHIVESCGTGERALELMKNKGYDVILLDYKLPDFSGLEVLRRMHEKNIDTPVIMLTGLGTEEIAVNSMKHGAYDYISKAHLEIDRLPLTINNVYERHLLRKEMEHRKLQERKQHERQEELAVLQTFQNTVSSVGQFVTNSLSTLGTMIQHREEELMKFTKKEGQEEMQKTFSELKHELEVISSGVKSMLDLSALVTQKLDEIQQSQPQPDKKLRD
jgi:DNA-binding NtrC family response regulator